MKSLSLILLNDEMMSEISRFMDTDLFFLDIEDLVLTLNSKGDPDSKVSIHLSQTHDFF